MKAGFSTVFYISEKPVAPHEERSLILAHVYRLAYEDYFNDSIGKRLSRFLRLAKPKRVSVIAKLAYQLRIVPFGTNEVFISDTFSSCAEKIEIISFDPKPLNESSDGLQVVAKTNSDQTAFIRQLKSVSLAVDSFGKNAFGSPFVNASDVLVKEIVRCLPSLETPVESAPTVAPEHEEANRPEKLSTTLSIFLENSKGYITSLEHASNRVSECCQQMIAGIQQRYSISQQQLRTDVHFGWEVPTVSSDKWDSIIKPVDELIAGLRLEAQPDIDKIERESKLEIGKLEQEAKLSAKEIERNYDIERDNKKRETDLLLKRFRSEEKSLESHVALLESEHDEAVASCQKAQQDYDKSLASGSLGTSKELLENLERLRRNEDDLREKLRDAEETLRTVRSQFNDTKKRCEGSLEKLEQSRDLKLNGNEEKLKIAIEARQEARNRSINDKLAHAAAISQERSLLENLVKTSMSNVAENFQTTEPVELQNLWRNETLLDLKTGAIENLQRCILKGIEDALKSIDQTKRFLKDHLVTIDTTSTVTTEILIPFWYIEIKAGSTDHHLVETRVVSPSDVVAHKLEEKTKTILGITFIPRLPAVASVLDSVKGYSNVRSQGRLNNQIRALDPAEFLPADHWIVANQHIAERFYQTLRNDFKKQPKP
ncbi:hypothetical protein MUP01_10110 [Candidatus Bathyarchaeota archaeon]|nr:hypothetical protein [Candidatus Bathyarchaeota archaeon]